MVYSVQMDGTERHSLRQLKKMFKKTLYSHSIPLSVIRNEYDRFFYFPHIPNNADIQRISIGTLPIDRIKPELAAADRAIIYAHGGGFVSGSCKASRNMCVSLAHECNSTLFLPEYRLAPEYPFPAGLDDLYALYTGIMHQSDFKPHNIIFAGDGAGCSLVTALIHRLKMENIPLPAALVLISPWVDLTCSNPKLKTLGKNDAFVLKEALEAAASRYTLQENFTKPLVSPLYGSFTKFPPVFIQCGSKEILAADAESLAAKIEADGGTVILDIWKNMWHLFQAMEEQSDEAHRAVEKIGLWVQSQFKPKRKEHAWN